MSRHIFQNLLLGAACCLAHSRLIAEESHLVSVRMTKEEIAQASAPNFIKQRDLSHVLYEKISIILTTLTARHGGSNRALVDMANSIKEVTHETRLKREAVLHYEQPEAPRPDADKIRVHLLGQTRKSGEVKFKETFPLISEIQKGFSFNWTPGQSILPKKQVSSAPPIRYGLVVQDIVPQEAPSLALLAPMSDSYRQYARPAKVVYTIDRLEADTSSNLVFPNIPVIDPEKGSAAPPRQSFFRKPSTDLAVKVEAANSEDSVSDKVGGGALPGGKVTISQVDGLVSTQIITTPRLGKESMTFDTKLPIYGEANITRKYNEKFKVMQTSANNLLVSADAPKLNIHHIRTEERYKGELLMKRPTFEFGLAVEPRPTWTPGQKARQVGDKVSLTFSNTF